MFPDFSRYQHALSPIIVCDETLTLIYINPIGKRAFPMFTNNYGLYSYYDMRSADYIREQLRNGQAVSRASDHKIDFEMLFCPIPVEPEMSPCAFVYVINEGVATSFSGGAFLSDQIRVLNRRIQYPMRELAFSLNRISNSQHVAKDPELLSEIGRMQAKILNISLFLSGMDEVGKPREFVMCDVNDIVRLCKSAFRCIHYRCGPAFFVPIDRNDFFRIVVDIVNTLYFSPDLQPRIDVSVSIKDGERLICFSADYRPLEFEGSYVKRVMAIHEALTVSAYRVQCVGGKFEVNANRKAGCVTVLLHFPEVFPIGGKIRVSDPSLVRIPETERNALTYLYMLDLDFLASRESSAPETCEEAAPSDGDGAPDRET